MSSPVKMKTFYEASRNDQPCACAGPYSALPAYTTWGPVITLAVGPEPTPTPLEVHTGILTNASPVFRRAFATNPSTGTSTWREGATRTYALPEDDPDTIATCLSYLYTGRLWPLSTDTARHPHHYVPLSWEVLVGAAVFANVYEMAGLHNAAVSAIVDAVVQRWAEGDRPTHLIPEVYASTPPGSALRRLFMHVGRLEPDRAALTLMLDGAQPDDGADVQPDNNEADTQPDYKADNEANAQPEEADARSDAQPDEPNDNEADAQPSSAAAEDANDADADPSPVADFWADTTKVDALAGAEPIIMIDEHASDTTPTGLKHYNDAALLQHAYLLPASTPDHRRPPSVAATDHRSAEDVYVVFALRTRGEWMAMPVCDYLHVESEGPREYVERKEKEEREQEAYRARLTRVEMPVLNILVEGEYEDNGLQALVGVWRHVRNLKTQHAYGRD